MKKLALMTLVLVLVTLAGPGRAGDIDPGLARILSSAPADQPVSVLVFLRPQADLAALDRELAARGATLRERHETIVVTLQETARSSQPGIVAALRELQGSGAVTSFRAFWVSNVIRVDARRSAIESIATRADVDTVYFNYEIEGIEPVEVRDGTGPFADSVEPGITAVRAPEVWSLGITGEGVLVANIDTGVDGNHPALASRWAGAADPRYAGHPEWAWFDPYLGQNDFPYDNHGHGTHTMGSICGGAPGDGVGVAPGALWIAAAAIDRGGTIARTVSDAILSFEWVLDPDGDPSTSWDVPDVCSNSWGLRSVHGYPPCDPLFWSYIDACETAGMVVLFSAGNSGTTEMGRPADRATDAYRSCAVAAVDANTAGWPIAYFSSRGPTYCTPDGSPAIKPDIAGPGVSVRSSYPGGGYVSMSGTSMACPHVAGVAALVRQANPNLTVDEIKQILYDNAHDLGSPGEDNDYGWGMVDAYEAVMAAMPQDLPPVADFTGSPTSGFAPLTVQFDDLSQNGPTSWSWTFGDGGTSTEQDPSYTYVAPGTYTVTLVATNDHGSDTDTKVDYIVVDEPTPPVADFSATPTSGDLPLAVQFTDLSTGNPTSWSWTFGDGGTSTQSNPTHTYTVAGTYTVSLAVTNQHGSDVETKTDYIVVTEPQQSTLIVDSIIATRVWVSRRHMALEAEVVIVDQDGQPVSGATVYGYFNEPSTSVVSGTTGASGSVTFVSDRTKSPPASWCFTVTDVVLAGAVYDPPPTPPEGCN